MERGLFPPAEGIPAASPEEKAVREQMRKQAIATLKLAIAEGWNNFAHLRIDADPASLHGEAEFRPHFPDCWSSSAMQKAIRCLLILMLFPLPRSPVSCAGTPKRCFGGVRWLVCSERERNTLLVGSPYSGEC